MLPITCLLNAYSGSFILIIKHQLRLAHEKTQITASSLNFIGEHLVRNIDEDDGEQVKNKDHLKYILQQLYEKSN